MKEKFTKLIIDGYETKYIVSSYGRVFDTERSTEVCIHNNNYITVKDQKYNLSKTRPTIELRINGERKHYNLARVILLAFNPIDNYYEMEVDHLDGNPSNNILTNLEWVTHEENMKRAKANKLFRHDDNHHNSKYSNDLIHKICRLICLNTGRKEIMELCGVNGQLVDDIRSGRSHKHISEKYIDSGFRYKKVDKELKEIRENLVRKICELIEAGYTNTEIRKILNLEINDTCLPNDIRKHRVFKYISNEFNF